jgi:hypothetical protein
LWRVSRAGHAREYANLANAEPRAGGAALAIDDQRTVEETMRQRTTRFWWPITSLTALLCACETPTPPPASGDPTMTKTNTPAASQSSNNVAAASPAPRTEAPTTGATSAAPTTTTGELGERAKSFVALLDKGRYDEARKDFDQAMTQAASVQMLTELWGGLVAKLGAFQSVTHVSQTQNGAHTMVVVTCKFASDSVGLRVVFDGARKIAGLQIVAPEGAP